MVGEVLSNGEKVIHYKNINYILKSTDVRLLKDPVINS
jgi:hypothetical protein